MKLQAQRKEIKFRVSSFEAAPSIKKGDRIRRLTDSDSIKGDDISEMGLGHPIIICESESEPLIFRVRIGESGRIGFGREKLDSFNVVVVNQRR